MLVPILVFSILIDLIIPINDGLIVFFSMLKTSYCRMLISHGSFGKESWLCSELPKTLWRFGIWYLHVLPVYCTAAEPRKGTFVELLLFSSFIVDVLT